MKTLLILRHAKSSWSSQHLSDFERPLNNRGKRDASMIGSLLRSEDLVPDMIISSSAERAHSTSEAVATASGYEGEIETTRRLYLAGPEEYSSILQQISNKYSRVLVVGHNPGMEELLEDLADSYERLPTAALAQIELPIDNWSEFDLDTVKGKLVDLWLPRLLRL